jgi:hypothetical protein
LESDLSYKSKPRNRNGNAEALHCNIPAKLATCSLEEDVISISDFYKFIFNPQIFPKIFIIAFRILICCSFGFTNSKVSSAYNKQLLHPRNTGCNSCDTFNLMIQRTRKSIANMKIYGDSGSPCLTPHFKTIFLRETEFKNDLRVAL